MTKFERRYDNFISAVKRLNEGNSEYKKHAEIEAYQDSLIQRFEFSFELAWKTLREFMTEQGYLLEIASPKGIIAKAYQEGIIQDENLWLEMISDRNASSHDYGRELAEHIAERISLKYCKELTTLKNNLKR